MPAPPARALSSAISNGRTQAPSHIFCEHQHSRALDDAIQVLRVVDGLQRASQRERLAKMQFVSTGAEVVEYTTEGGLAKAGQAIVVHKEIPADGSAERPAVRAPARPLYEQLQEQRAALEAVAKERSGAVHRAPRGLDEEDVAFLDEHEASLRRRDLLQHELEEADHMTFQLAMASRTAAKPAVAAAAPVLAGAAAAAALLAPKVAVPRVRPAASTAAGVVSVAAAGSSVPPAAVAAGSATKPSASQPVPPAAGAAPAASPSVLGHRPRPASDGAAGSTAEDDGRSAAPASKRARVEQAAGTTAAAPAAATASQAAVAAPPTAAPSVTSNGAAAAAAAAAPVSAAAAPPPPAPPKPKSLLVEYSDSDEEEEES